jgi:RimJ/RimL family protein N-acetyltransferase
MLQGDRVRLRSVSRDDLPLLWEFNNDLAVELAGGGDPPYPQSLARLQAEFDQDAAKGGRDRTSFVIEVDGKCIGTCGLFNVNTTAQTCELGIGIGDKGYWGKGHGRDSVRRLLEYAFKYLNYRKVWLRVHGRNERGMRAYRACGFVEEGRQRAHVWSDGTYDDLVLMGVLREEWQAARNDAPRAGTPAEKGGRPAPS